MNSIFSVSSNYFAKDSLLRVIDAGPHAFDGSMWEAHDIALSAFVCTYDASCANLQLHGHNLNNVELICGGANDGPGCSESNLSFSGDSNASVICEAGHWTACLGFAYTCPEQWFGNSCHMQCFIAYVSLMCIYI